MTAPDDKTAFKDLVKGVVPLSPGPRVVPAVSEHKAAVVVRSRSPRSLAVEDLGGVLLALASDAPANVAHDLATLPPDRQYRRIDLHRMTASRAIQALGVSLRQARAERERYLLVICGKGTHSGATGPVLQRLVVDELSGPLADDVIAFRTAPRGLGGEGAFVVRVRAPKSART